MAFRVQACAGRPEHFAHRPNLYLFIHAPWARALPVITFTLTTQCRRAGFSNRVYRAFDLQPVVACIESFGNQILAYTSTHGCCVKSSPVMISHLSYRFHSICGEITVEVMTQPDKPRWGPAISPMSIGHATVHALSKDQDNLLSRWNHAPSDSTKWRLYWLMIDLGQALHPHVKGLPSPVILIARCLLARVAYPAYSDPDDDRGTTVDLAAASSHGMLEKRAVDWRVRVCVTCTAAAQSRNFEQSLHDSFKTLASWPTIAIRSLRAPGDPTVSFQEITPPFSWQQLLRGCM
nr:hypothetical protein CFP56_25735 [Quercus suber]